MTAPIWAAGAEILPNGALRAALLASDGHKLLGFGPCASAEGRMALPLTRSGKDGKFARPEPLADGSVANGLPAGQVLQANRTHPKRSAEPTSGGGIEAQLAMLLGELPDWQLAGVIGPPLANFDGALLAQTTGRGVVWGFETAGSLLGAARGSEDAFYHHALLRWLGVALPAAVLDLGPVARLTWVDPRIPDPAAPGACLAFDAGPGVDPGNAALAETGAVLGDLPERLLDHPFFRRPLPRSLDAATAAELGALRQIWLDAQRLPMRLEDAVTTQAACAAAGISTALGFCPEPPSLMLVTGASQHHRAALRMIHAGSAVPLRFAAQLGLTSEHLRAQAAAFLAIRVKRDLTTTSSWFAGSRAAVASAYFAAGCKSLG